MAKERYLTIGSISVEMTNEAAFLKFLLNQVIDDDKWIFVIDDSQKFRCEFGIVAQLEDLDKIEAVLEILDYEDIEYISSFELSH